MLRLEVLFLSNNAQDWEMGRLSNLKILALCSNNLTGRIASEITNFTKLTYLSLAHINLTGEIPSELGNVHQIYIDSTKLQAAFTDSFLLVYAMALIREF
jgi:Leucine-rich repeat (LRR) protein